MLKVPINFCFKGNRNYVHGTDMYNNIITILNNNYDYTKVSNFKFSIHKFAKKNCYFVLYNENEKQLISKEYISNVSFEVDNIPYKGHFIEEDKKIECRNSYDEEVVTSQLKISKENEVKLEGESPYTFIETLVAMTKYLHYECYPSEHKWIFTKLELSRINKLENKNISVKLIKNLKNVITKAEIIYENTVIGYIYFSLVVK